MPSDIKQQTIDLVNQYLELQSQQDSLQKKLDDLKVVIAKFSKDTNQKHLKSGNTILKVSQYDKTVFPKVDEKGRNEVMKIMYASVEYQHSVTFDIVKLGLAYDKNKLSPELKEKLQPFTRQEPVIRVTKAKLNYPKKNETQT